MMAEGSASAGQLRVFPADVACRHGGDQKPLVPVQDSQAEKVSVEENPKGIKQALEEVDVFAPFEHFLRGQVGVKLDPLKMFLQRVAGVVQDFTGHRLDAAVHPHGLMNVFPAPPGLAPVEKANLVIRIPAGMKDPAAKVASAARKAISVRGGFGVFPATNCSLGFGIEFLIRIQAQDPVVLGVAGGKVFLRRVSLPGLVDDPRSQARRDGRRLVSRAGVDHHNFIGTGQRAQGAREVVGLVAGDHCGRNRRHGQLTIITRSGTITLVSKWQTAKGNPRGQWHPLKGSPDGRSPGQASTTGRQSFSGDLPEKD